VSAGGAQFTASIRVAVNSQRKGADGDNVERTDWFRVRTIGSKADYAQRFTKDQRDLVAGRLDISEWHTREGEKRTSYVIWADDVVNQSPREHGARGHGESSSTSSAPHGRSTQPVAWRGQR